MHKQQETWSELSVDHCQVLICDLQEQIVARSKTTKPDALSQSAEVLCRIARLFDIPVTFSVVPEQEREPNLLSSLKPFATGQNQFLRANASPLLEPKTTQHLSSLKRKTLLIAGFASEVVVLHATVQAIQAGYRVIVVADASGGSSENTERAAMQQMHDFGAVISSVLSIGTALGPDFTSEKGKQLFQTVQSLRLA
jgi:hypothetical protein